MGGDDRRSSMRMPGPVAYVPPAGGTKSTVKSLACSEIFRCQQIDSRSATQVSFDATVALACRRVDRRNAIPT